jgi:hypothetical protein
MNKGRVCEDRGSKEMDGCPLTPTLPSLPLSLPPLPLSLLPLPFPSVMSASAISAIIAAASIVAAAVSSATTSDRCPHTVNPFGTWTYYPKVLRL